MEKKPLRKIGWNGGQKMSGNEFAVAIQSGYKQGYEDGGIKELEKIKAEINDIKLELDSDYYTGDKITRLIDKHITELKGENNEPCN